MGNFADRIQSILQEKLCCYRQLADLLEEDRQIILAMNVDSLWRVAGKKNEIAGQIESIRKKIITILDDHGIAHSMDAASFRLSFLGSRIIGDKERARIETLIVAINSQKNEIHKMAGENKKYITDYLKVIGDVMSTIVRLTDQDQYEFSGKLCESKESNHFIKAEV